MVLLISDDELMLSFFIIDILDPFYCVVYESFNGQSKFIKMIKKCEVALNLKIQTYLASNSAQSLLQQFKNFIEIYMQTIVMYTATSNMDLFIADNIINAHHNMIIKINKYNYS